MSASVSESETSLTLSFLCFFSFTGCGVNPARTLGPSAVVCMSSTGDCSAVISSWYWIYWIGPFVAAWLVAEVTALMEWNVDEVEDVVATKITTDMDELVDDVVPETPTKPKQSSISGEGAC